ncbi:MAG: flagellar basal body P-ring protein FlgI [Limisphaerales bacterium]
MPLVPRTLRPKTRRCGGQVKIPTRPVRAVKLVALSFSLLMFTAILPASRADGVRVRDLAMLSGARDNQLVGYGLVGGLANDGDKDPIYTQQTFADMLQRYGLNIPAASMTQISSKNIAVVMVTADIPAFVKSGQRLDVQVASMGDAKSLQGGVLFQTPLFGADNKVYAVAQGPLSIGGFSAGTGGASVTKNHPTVGTIIGGALVENEIPTTVVHDHSVELLLNDPDFTSAARVAAAVNNVFTNCAHAVDSTSVRVNIPPSAEASLVDFIAQLDSIEVTPDTPARIIINERTGTIVATSRIQISSCAIAQGNITIDVASTLDVSQPAPFSSTGTTTVTPRTDTTVSETKASLVALPELPTVEKVASALNTLGATPRDIMAILEAMKQAGALQAELIIK